MRLYAQSIEKLNLETSGMFRVAAILLKGCSDIDLYVLSNVKHIYTFTLKRILIISDLIPLCNLLGILYQIRDDYCNLASKDVRSKKIFSVLIYCLNMLTCLL